LGFDRVRAEVGLAEQGRARGGSGGRERAGIVVAAVEAAAVWADGVAVLDYEKRAAVLARQLRPDLQVGWQVGAVVADGAGGGHRAALRLGVLRLTL
jgi:hypothetical protein